MKPCWCHVTFNLQRHSTLSTKDFVQLAFEHYHIAGKCHVKCAAAISMNNGMDSRLFNVSHLSYYRQSAVPLLTDEAHLAFVGKFGKRKFNAHQCILWNRDTPSARGLGEYRSVATTKKAVYLTEITQSALSLNFNMEIGIIEAMIF